MIKPAVSVVLPVYNAENFIGQALDSISAQTYRDFEAIVIDDGSTDSSLEVIRTHVGADDRFRIVSRPNRGIVATLNEGIEMATGEYIFRMDADDVSYPSRFEMQLAFFAQNPGCVALGTRTMLADEELLPIIEMVGSFTHEEIDAENLRGQGSAMCHPSVAMRRESVLAVGGYRARYEWAEDLDLFLRLAEVGTLANLRDVLITYRQHLASVGHGKRMLQMERTSLAVAEATRRRGERAGKAFAAAPTETTAPSGYASIAEIHRKWGWLALQGGHPKTARKHAFEALKLQPFNPANPRLIACAVRGY